MLLSPDFRVVLGEHDLGHIERSDNVIVGLDARGRIRLVNAAWRRFAQDNDGAAIASPELGLPYLGATPPVLRYFYQEIFDRVRATGRPEETDYECSSEDTYRHFLLRVVPLEAGGLLLVHHCLEAHPHGPDRPAHPFMPELYRHGHGLIRQCSHCRMLRRVSQPETWDWVPELIRNPRDDITHGLCPICRRHYYPEVETSG